MNSLLFAIFAILPVPLHPATRPARPAPVSIVRSEVVFRVWYSDGTSSERKLNSVTPGAIE